jgi:hypothetical protein
MHGLLLPRQCFKARTRYGIREIVDGHAVEISELYRAVHQNFLIYGSPDGKSLSDAEGERLDRECGRFLIEEQEQSGAETRELKLFGPGFLPRFRDYLYGDWNRSYLLSKRVFLDEIQFWSNQVPPAREIFICCVDAAYGEVYARDAALLERLKERFPDAVPRDLADKTY